MTVSSRLRKRIGLALAMLPVLLFVYVTVALFLVHRQTGVAFSYRNAGTDLVFASSGGGWTAEEDLIRGTHFEDIVVAHELYKILCRRPDAQLVRIKPRKKPWNWAFWFDDYDDLKWRVPYTPASNTPDRESCALKPPTAADIATATRAARQTIARLAAT